jgi:hypothetical protein
MHILLKIHCSVGKTWASVLAEPAGKSYLVWAAQNVSDNNAKQLANAALKWNATKK